MKKLSILIASFSAKVLVAQIPATTNWFGFQFRINRSDKWEFVNDLGYRTIGMSASCYNYFYRNGIRYKFNESWNVAAGAAVFFTRSSYQKSNHEFGRELRLWQEGIFRKPFARTFAVNDRFRTEERWFNSVTGKPGYFGLRLRERITFTKTLTEKWSLEFGDEYLRMLSEKKFLFNANRILLLAACKLKNEMLVQGGYIWLKLPTASQHVFTINLQKNILLARRKNS